MLAAPNCYTRGCKHLEGVIWLGDEESSEVVVCPAFPKGIPDEIAYGANKHLVKYPGQTGDVVFEKE